MNKNTTLIILAIIVTLLILLSCGTKINRPKELPTGGVIGETTYVQIDPPWDEAHGYSFNNPRKIIVGRDTYIYIADTDNNRIVQLDAHGTVQATHSVPHPIGITQDELLRLLVVTGDTKNIYKIDVVGLPSNRQAVLCYLWQDNVTNDTAMVKSSDIFTDISCAAGYVKRYYVTAATPSVFGSGKLLVFQNQIDKTDTTWWRGDSSFTSPILPYDSIVIRYDDYLLNRKYLVGNDTCTNPQIGYGTGLGSTSHPNGITAFGRSGRNYLLYTQDSSYFKCQLLAYNNNTYYRLGWYASAFIGSDNDLHRNNYFIKPAAATVDSSGSIFVVGPRISAIDTTWWKGDSSFTHVVPDFDSVAIDTLINYVHKFDSAGKLKMSFGTLGNGPGQLDSTCSGIAYDNFANRKTVYISDTGNNRILRYKLSTDIGH